MGQPLGRALQCILNRRAESPMDTKAYITIEGGCFCGTVRFRRTLNPQSNLPVQAR